MFPNNQNAKLTVTGVLTRGDTGEVIDLGEMSSANVNIRKLMYENHPNPIVRALWWMEKKLRGIK